MAILTCSLASIKNICPLSTDYAIGIALILHMQFLNDPHCSATLQALKETGRESLLTQP